MQNSTDDKIVVYSRTLNGQKLESMYSYALLKEGVYLAWGCNSTIEEVAAKLKAWRYNDVKVWVESEVDFYKRTSDFGRVGEITEKEFKEYFNCLPPVRHVYSSYMEAFMIGEEVAAQHHLFCVRLNNRYFTLTEHFQKSYTDIEQSVKEYLVGV